MSKTRFNFEQVVLPGADSFEHFYSLMLYFDSNERYRVRAWESEAKMRFEVHLSNENENQFRRWDFDMTAGGVCVDYQDLIVASSCYMIHVDYVNTKNVAVPSFYRRDEFSRGKNGKWSKRVEHNFFDLKVGADDAEAFSAQRLPMDAGQRVSDRRSGRINQLQFGDLQ